MDFTQTAAGVVSRAIGEDLFKGTPLPEETKETKARAEKLSRTRRKQIAK